MKRIVISQTKEPITIPHPEKLPPHPEKLPEFEPPTDPNKPKIYPEIYPNENPIENPPYDLPTLSGFSIK
jgi:hypothetical protein